MILADTSVLVSEAGLDTPEPLAVSVVSLGELQVGIRTAADEAVRAGRLARLELIGRAARIITIDRRVADAYARLRADSGRQPANDLWIAATAVAHDLTLVTADRGQARLPGVRGQLIAD